MLDASVAWPYSSRDFLSAANLDLADNTVLEVYSQMLGLAVSVSSRSMPCPEAGEERTAIVGYSGSMRGCCEIQMNEPAAKVVATAMLGGISVEDDESLNDAVGEICNMIAGGWKDRVPELSSRCALSPPTIITGRAYKVHMIRPSLQVLRCYRFEDQHMFLALRRED